MFVRPEVKEKCNQSLLWLVPSAGRFTPYSATSRQANRSPLSFLLALGLTRVGREQVETIELAKLQDLALTLLFAPPGLVPFLPGTPQVFAPCFQDRSLHDFFFFPARNWERERGIRGQIFIWIPGYWVKGRKQLCPGGFPSRACLGCRPGWQLLPNRNSFLAFKETQTFHRANKRSVLKERRNWSPREELRARENRIIFF